MRSHLWCPNDPRGLGKDDCGGEVKADPGTGALVVLVTSLKQKTIIQEGGGKGGGRGKEEEEGMPICASRSYGQRRIREENEVRR